MLAEKTHKASNVRVFLIEVLVIDWNLNILFLFAMETCIKRYYKTLPIGNHSNVLSFDEKMINNNSDH